MDVVELLRSKGLRKTPQRVMLIDILYRSGTALTEEDVKSEMGEFYDRVTFYRSVQTLIDVGLIHRVTIDNKTTKYALNNRNEASPEHDHFYCLSCGRVTCMSDRTTLKIDLPEGFEAFSHQILIRGLCKECRDKQIGPAK